MSETIYKNWFAMRTNEEKNLAVVVAELLNDELWPLECNIVSDPMPLGAAEALAVRNNLGAIRDGNHVSAWRDPRKAVSDTIISELREIRAKLEALEQRIDNLDQNEQQRHHESVITICALIKRISGLKEGAHPAHTKE
jgi:hypothetical protein